MKVINHNHQIQSLHIEIINETKSIMFSKLLIFIWKDLLIARRSKIWTLFELVIPVACIVAYAHTVKFAGDAFLVHYNNSDAPLAEMQLTVLNKTDWNISVEVAKQDKQIFEYRLINRVAFIQSRATEGDWASIDFDPNDYYIEQHKINTDYAKDVVGIDMDSWNVTLSSFPGSGMSTQMQQMERSIVIYLGIAFQMIVMGVCRNIVMEKISVKPYLTAMGLTTWDFYLSHYLFALMKIGPLILGAFSYMIYLLDRSVLFLVVIVFYIFAALSFALFFSVFFKKSNRVIEGVLVVWFAAAMIPSFDRAFSSWQTLLVSLNMHYALDFFQIVSAELNGGGGLSFSTLFQSTGGIHYPCGVYLSILLFDAIWMFFAAIYIDILLEKISNVGFGIHLFRKRKAAGAEEEECEALLGHEAAETDEARLNNPADLEIEKVVKVYDTGEVAVNGLSLRAIRGQVSVLLGHNGCGKSTTFSMISGIQHPTEGRIEICGLDSAKNRNKCLKFIGFCPQYNPLYDKLTVWEHLKLVYKLKGNKEVKFEEEAEELTEAIGLYEKRNNLSSSLSGGMKRKLCICMALIGGSKVVLLDEPTAGIDIDARVQVQNMLEKCKENRTILLTTHYMDEAEKLGDWIFVMSHGKLGACGTSAFLKKQFGDGYLLTIVLKEENKNSTKLLKTICQTLVTGAVLKTSRGRLVEFNLPESQKSSFLKVLQVLDAIKLKQYDKADMLPSELRSQLPLISIHSMGLSLNSLEQVFIKIIEKCDTLTDVDGKKKAKVESFKTLISAKQKVSISGILLLTAQLSALFKKRLLYLSRNWSQLIFQVFLPILILIYIFGDAIKDPKLVENLDLSNFPESVVFVRLYQDNPKVMDYLKKYKNLDVRQKPLTANIGDLLAESRKDGLKTGFILTQSSEKNFNIDFNNEATRADFMVIQLLTNLVLMMNGNAEIKGTVEWKPIIVQHELSFSVFRYSLILGLVFALFVTSTVIVLIDERVSKFEHQQDLTPLTRNVFWFSNYSFDMSMVSLVAIATWGYLFYEGIFVSVGFTALLFFAYIFAFIPFIYLFSRLINTPSKAMIVISSFQLFLLPFPMIIIIYGMFKKWDSTFQSLCYTAVAIICPSGAFFVGVMRLYSEKISVDMMRYVTGYQYYEWNGVPRDVVLIISFGILFMLVFFLTTILKIRLFKSNKQPTKKSLEFTAEMIANYEENEGRTHSKEKTGEGTHSKEKTGEGTHSKEKTGEGTHSKEKTGERTHSKEKTGERTHSKEKTGERTHSKEKRFSICAEKIVKDYRSFRALDGLTVKIKEGECFGLLGVNGAGKTTFFEILTGSRKQSGGIATINDVDTNGKVMTGYCPQFDALLMDLTGEEVLKIMAQIHGYSNYSQIANYALTCVDMQEHKKKQVKYCSGGQKRRISIAVALLSRSNCMILDEPTAGIDPKVRREVWEILEWEQQKAGCAILLSSHSMEECEALCQRIGILNKGRMVALGTSQELKSKYGNSYTMTLILKSADDFERIKDEVATKMPSSTLETTTVNKIMTWKLEKKDDDTWSGVWKNVEQLANELKVKDFMLVQSSLEDTFLALAGNNENKK